jgi:hypothetical protein
MCTPTGSRCNHCVCGLATGLMLSLLSVKAVGTCRCRRIIMTKVCNSPHERDPVCSIVFHVEVDTFDLLSCQYGKWTAAIRMAL